MLCKVIKNALKPKASQKPMFILEKPVTQLSQSRYPDWNLCFAINFRRFIIYCTNVSSHK